MPQQLDVRSNVGNGTDVAESLENQIAIFM
jgi:hypothetical protein